MFIYIFGLILRSKTRIYIYGTTFTMTLYNSKHIGQKFHFMHVKKVILKFPMHTCDFVKIKL